MGTYYGNDLEQLNSRIPVQPLPYENRALATERELLVDYKDGKLFVVSDTGQIIDISAKLAELVQNGNSSNSEITIEGLGTVKLARLLELLWENRITFTASEQTGVYLPRNKQVDFKSIEIKDNKIQVSNFDMADNNTIPIKIGDTIYWRRAATADSTELHPVQGDGNSIDYVDGVFSIIGFNDAKENQVLAKVNGKTKFISINADGSLGMTDEEKEQLVRNTNDIDTLKKTADDLQSAIDFLRSTMNDNSVNLEELIKKYSDMSVKLEMAISDISRINAIFDEFDYKQMMKDMEDLKLSLKEYAAETVLNTNNIEKINKRITSLNEDIASLLEALNNHIKDDNVHTAVHFMEESIPVEERLEGHLYIMKNAPVINDIPDTYTALIRGIGTNMGASVEFSIGEHSEYNLNSDLQIRED